MGTVYTVPNIGNDPTANTVISRGLKEASSLSATIYSGANADSILKAWYYNTSTDIRIIYNCKSDCVIYQAFTNSLSVNSFNKEAGISNTDWVENDIDEYYIDIYPDYQSAYNAIRVAYPITYHYTNSTVSGPSEAAVGDTVTVSAVPDVGYGITDTSSQILVTNNDVAVPYTWDAVNQRITFTMPDPS